MFWSAYILLPFRRGRELEEYGIKKVKPTIISFHILIHPSFQTFLQPKISSQKSKLNKVSRKKTVLKYVGFKDIAAVTMSSIILWDITPCSPVEVL
jgi:hypothetical protein